MDLMPRAHFDAISAQLSDEGIKTELSESLRQPKLPDGYYRINPQGKKLDDMFQFISKGFDSKVQVVTFNEKVPFYKENRPLSAVVRRSGVGDNRLLVDGDDRLDGVAPVVVVEGEDAV